jgi:hypothetical protein
VGAVPPERFVAGDDPLAKAAELAQILAKLEPLIVLASLRLDTRQMRKAKKGLNANTRI